MKSYRIAVEIAAALALAVLFAPRPAIAQLTTSTPVVVRQTPLKTIWLKATIVHADGHSMVVREQANPLALHTFTYSDGLQSAMRLIGQAGGYQYGDKVRIQYKQGGTVALRIKGKPSL
ncbi:MAG: hypothetical protein WA369_17440 [Candidatus Acidiferrales bacterium]